VSRCLNRSSDLRVGGSNPSGRASQFNWPKIRLFVLRRPLTYLASVTPEASKICHIKYVIDSPVWRALKEESQ